LVIAPAVAPAGAVKSEKLHELEETLQNLEKKTAAAPTPAVAVPETVAVFVKSEPIGAVISIEGMGQVCKQAPCEVMLKKGETVTFAAMIGARKTTMAFTPSVDNKEITLELKTAATKSKPAKKDSGSGNSATSDGLKIPGIFREN
jgi:hypothetical protein